MASVVAKTIVGFKCQNTRTRHDNSFRGNCLRWLVAQAFRNTNIRGLWLSWCAFSSRQTTFEGSCERKSKYGHTGTHTHQSIQRCVRNSIATASKNSATYGEWENVLGAPEYETIQQKQQQQLWAYLRLCWCERCVCASVCLCVSEFRWYVHEFCIFSFQYGDSSVWRWVCVIYCAAFFM